MVGESPPVLCFNLQERLLPHLRAETARRLSERGLRQGRIAEHLGVSQAMVSKYLRIGVPVPPGVDPRAVRDLVDRAAERVTQDEQKGTLPPWCPFCPGASLPAAHASVLDECLRTDQPQSRDATTAVLDNVRAAAIRLRRRHFGVLAPQVQINLAMAVPSARDARGVAAFPGRLAEVDGQLRAVTEPAFGASHHLSDVLLRVRRHQPRVGATMCLRAGDDVRRALQQAGFRTRVLPRVRGDLQVTVPAGENVDALVDPGDFGVEPITYLLGETALDVVEKAERVLDRLTTKTKPNR